MQKQKQLDIDGNTLEIASFSDLPSQPVNFDRASAYLGKQIRQLQFQLNPPVVNAQAPLTIVRRNLLNGTFQYRVQFVAPTKAQDPSYQSTSVVLQTPTGTVRFAAGAATGPIIFNAAQSSAPGSLALQQNNNNGSSVVELGTGNSRTLIQQ
jgi:hypothetical protein